MGSESIGAVILSKSSSSSEEKVFPPGFRFHPTDEELILYYLKRKICGRSLKLDIVGEVDVYKWDPEELPGKSKWKTGDRQWFFFSPRDRKYATGARSNRATMHGYWKATGKDRTINCNSRVVGLKKTLVYYHGRAPSGQRTDWVMHEYTLDEDELKKCKLVQEYYVLYKLFKKSGPGPKNGEQYGAPFVEEEWADDYEYMVQNINTLVNEPKSMVESGIVPPVAQINPVNIEDIDQGIPLGLGPSSGLDLDQSANEPSVITSVEEMNPLSVNENFLELDDLIGPQPVFQKSEMPLLADFDEFSLFDLYNDSTTFNETNLFESQQLSNLEFESYLNETRSEAVINNEDFTNAQATDVTIFATSGVITNEKLENPDLGVNQCRGFGEDDGSGSWFSSALWAFVESVSARPASAVEVGSLVNKEFSRINNANGGDGVECTLVTRRVKRSSRSSSRGSIVFFSVLGILFSILWVFVGTSIELLGRCLLR